MSNSIHFSPFRPVSGQFGQFRAASGKSWGVGRGLSGIGECRFCKGKEYHYHCLDNDICNSDGIFSSLESLESVSVILIASWHLSPNKNLREIILGGDGNSLGTVVRTTQPKESIRRSEKKISS